ncbi:MAG: hypothetical protein ACRDZZ_01290 [Ilumatobacteraceae bacterium]
MRYVRHRWHRRQIHDLPVPATVDIDVTPARDRKNLERLARAFDELEAGLLTAEEAGTWFPRTPIELWSQYDTLHLMTNAGPIDIVFAPDGAPSGYADLADDAVSAELDTGAWALTFADESCTRRATPPPSTAAVKDIGAHCA